MGEAGRGSGRGDSGGGDDGGRGDSRGDSGQTTAGRGDSGAGGRGGDSGGRGAVTTKGCRSSGRGGDSEETTKRSSRDASRGTEATTLKQTRASVTTTTTTAKAAYQHIKLSSGSCEASKNQCNVESTANCELAGHQTGLSGKAKLKGNGKCSGGGKIVLCKPCYTANKGGGNCEKDYGLCSIASIDLCDKTVSSLLAWSTKK